MMCRRLVRLAPWWVLCLVAASACGATSGSPGAAPAGGPSGVAIARIDTRDAEVRTALRDQALAALSACDAEAARGAAGHVELSVEVDERGETVAGILHTTLGRDELVECLGRALTGVTMPARDAPYRVRLRFEGR